MSMYAIAGTRRDRQPPADHSLSKLPPASQSSGSEIAQRLSLNFRHRWQPTTTRLPEQIERCSLGGRASRQTDRDKQTCRPLVAWGGCRRSDAAPRAHLWHHLMAASATGGICDHRSRWRSLHAHGAAEAMRVMPLVQGRRQHLRP